MGIHVCQTIIPTITADDIMPVGGRSGISFNHTVGQMRIVSDKEHTAASIKSELEKLYAAASYVNADGAEIELVVNLIETAIMALDCATEESATEESPPLNLRLVQSDE